MTLWSRFPQSFVRITHEPTKVSAQAEGGLRTSLFKLKAKAMLLLQVRLAAHNSDVKKPEEVVYTYTFPDNDTWPDDITKYRKKIGPK